MESLLKTNPFYAGYFAVLVNVNDIAAMGGKALAMVDVISVKDDRICSQMLKGMERAVKKFNVPIVGGHTHPDCMYHAIDISIIGSVPKDQVILSSTAKDGDDIVFVIRTVSTHRTSDMHGIPLRTKRTGSSKSRWPLCAMWPLRN